MRATLDSVPSTVTPATFSIINED